MGGWSDEYRGGEDSREMIKEASLTYIQPKIMNTKRSR